MDVAAKFKCRSANTYLAQLLSGALTNTPINYCGGNKGAKAAATAIAMATEFVGNLFCNSGTAIAPDTDMEMEDEEVLHLGPVGTEPSPILIIDQFNCSSKENKQFANTLVQEAAAGGIVAFLITQDEKWASELVGQNDGTKCKPLPFNVKNPGYDGSQHFVGLPLWNSSFLASGESTGLGPLLLQQV